MEELGPVRRGSKCERQVVGVEGEDVDGLHQAIDGDAGLVRLEAKGVQRLAGDTGPLELAITLVVCNKDTCLLPATVKLAVK